MKRILVVDDHADNAASLAALLGMHGHEVKALTDPRQAVALARDFHPHIAFLDLGMPHLNGLQLAKAFSADAMLRGICLVALTAYDDDKTIGDARPLFEACLRKPARLESLLSILAQLEGR